jgi:hypothetical protein
MFRTIRWVGAVGLGVLFAGACGDDADVIDGRSLGGRGGRTGAGGFGVGGSRQGTAGTAGTGGSSGAAGVPAAGLDGQAVARPAPDASAGGGSGPDGGVVGVPPDAGDAGPLIPCVGVGDCEDNNVCTTQACVGSFCQFTKVVAGTVCGDQSTSECTAPDACSQDGVCLANHQPESTACSGGFCNLAGACDCAITRVTSVPHAEQWITIGSSGGGSDTNVHDGACQACANDLDHIVVFQAPAAGTYLFSARSTGSAQLWVVESDCTSLGAELGCDDGDVPPDGFDAQLELSLAAGQTVTLGVSEICEAEGGDGSLEIRLAED